MNTIKRLEKNTSLEDLLDLFIKNNGQIDRAKIESMLNTKLLSYEELMAENEKQANIKYEQIRQEANEQYKQKLNRNACLNKKWTFKNLSEDSNALGYPQIAFEFIRKFESYKTNPENIDAPQMLIIGSSGSGKSFYAGAIAHEFIDRGYAPLFVTFTYLLDQYFNRTKDQSNQAINESEHSDYLETLKKAEILIIDDLVTSASSYKSFYGDLLSNILRARINLNLSTIITSSLTLPDLHQLLGDYAFGSIHALRAQVLKLSDVNRRGTIHNYSPDQHLEISITPPSASEAF